MSTARKLFNAAAIMMICATATAQNRWILRGSPLEYHPGSGAVGPSNISAAYDPVLEQSIVYLLGDHRVYISRNNGESWQPIMTPDWDAEAVEAEPGNSQNAWVVNKGTGPYYTLNGGQLWQLKSNGLTNLQVQCLAISPQDPNLVVTGCAMSGAAPRIWKWEYLSQQWQSINGNLPSPSLGAKDLVIFDDDLTEPLIFAAYWAPTPNRYAIWFTGDLGLNWTEIPHDPPFSNIVDIEAARIGQDIILYATTTGAGGGLHKFNLSTGLWTTCMPFSTPAWVEISPIEPHNAYAIGTGLGFIHEDPVWGWIGVLQNIGFQDWTLAGLEICEANPSYFFTTTGTCFYQSEDSGQEWKQSMSNMDHVPLGFVIAKGDQVIALNKNAFATAAYPYTYLSINSGEYVEFNQHLAAYSESGTAIKDIEFATPAMGFERYLVAYNYSEGTDQPGAGINILLADVPFYGIFYPAWGYPWKTLWDVDQHSHPSGGNYGIAGGNHDGAQENFIIFNYLSGQTWQYSVPGVIYEVAADPSTDPQSSNAVYYTAGSAGIYRTTDSGQNWTDITYNLPGTCFPVQDIVVSQDGQRVFLATPLKIWTLDAEQAVWICRGPTYDPCSVKDLELGDRAGWIACLIQIPGSSCRAYASTRNGDSWFLMGTGLPDEDLRNITHSRNTFYIGSENGVYRLDAAFPDD